MFIIDEAFLTRVSPRFRGEKAAAQFEIINQIAPVFQAIIARYQIETRLRTAHFLAQILHESAGLRTTEEFASGAAYEGRLSLGNTEPGDGRRFKGRGLLQLTGRANYKRLGQQLDVDLVADPKRAAEPELSLIIACEYWKQHKINSKADRDDLQAVTRAINGGLNGLADRRRYLSKVKHEWDRSSTLSAGKKPPAGMLYLRRGSKGKAVAKLQRQLVSKGFHIAVDGDFGPATDQAVRAFQKNSKLVVDGILGPQTSKKLAESSTDKQLSILSDN